MTMAEGNVQSGQMRVNTFVLVNVPDIDDREEYLSDYLDATLSEMYNVDSLNFHPGIPDRVLVVLDKDINLNEAQDSISDTPLKGQYLRLEPAESMNAVIVEGNNLQSNLSPWALMHYFEREFGDGCQIVSNYVQITHCSQIAVLFIDTNVTRKVLECEILTPLVDEDYKVQVNPFFSNFHGCISHRGKSLLRFLEENSNSEDPPRVYPSRPLVSPKPSPSPKHFPGPKPVPSPKAHQRKINIPLRNSHWHLLKESLKRMNLSSIHYGAEAEVLTFESVNSDADDEECIEDAIADVIESSVELSEGVSELFETTHGRKYLKSYLASEWSDDKDVYIDIHGGFLSCFGLDDDKIDDVKDKVMADLFTCVEVDNQSLHLETLENVKESLENKYKVHISWSEERGRKMKIVGIQDDVFVVKDRIHMMMDDTTTATKYFDFSEDQSAYILEHCQEEITNILKNVESSQDSANDKLSIKFSGKSKEVEKVMSALDEILNSLKSEDIDVANEFSTDDANLIMKELSLLSPGSYFHKAHDCFMAKNKCCIINDLDEESDLPSSASVLPTKSRKRIGHLKSYVSKASTFILNPHTQLKIKDNGNIIRERSDVLVCVLDGSRKLTKTNVSKAFLGVEKNLQNTVDALSFSSNGVGIVPFSSRTIKCKALVFVTLSSFEQGATENYLHDIILEVLTKAAEFKANSISFPPIGSGRILKYPEDVISSQFFSAVKEFVDNASGPHLLRKIKFLACKKSLFYNLNERGKTLFRKILKDKDTMKEKDNAEHRERNDQVPGDGDDFLVKNANIRIIHRRSESLASTWKMELEDYVNHQEEINTLLKSFPPSVDDIIKKKLKTIPVLITLHTSKSDHRVIKMKGSYDRVINMKAFIAEEIRKESKVNSQRPLPPAPSRDTVAYMRYIASLEVTVPPYWKKKNSVEGSLHDVSNKTSRSIEKLLLATWDSTKVGAGNDAKGIPSNSKLEFVSVKRIESPAAYKVYASFRNQILKRKAREGKICKSVKEVSSMSHPVLTSANLPDFMKQELCGEINEHYLFHGTSQDTVDPIIKQGCCPNLSSPYSMLGKGIYAAESSTKADQYTDDPKNRLSSGSIHTMFLVRIFLGDVFKCTKQHRSMTGKIWDRLVRPPCKKCHEDKCLCGNNFDSVMAEEDWIFREFVVYQHCQCYPEYLIKYKRIY